MEALICVLAIPAALFVWMLISPQSMWRSLTAWQYRNPEANEPSDVAYAMQRFGAVVGLILMVVIAAVLVDASNQREERREQELRERQREEYEECLLYADDDSLLSPEEFCAIFHSPDPEP